MAAGSGGSGQSDQAVFESLWELGKQDPTACCSEIRGRAGRLRASGESLSIQLLGLHGMALLSQIGADGIQLDQLPHLPAVDRTRLAGLCEDGLSFIIDHWHLRESNPEFWTQEIIEAHLGKFAVLLTELRPGFAEDMLAARVADLPADIADMLDIGIADDLERVACAVSRHASQAAAGGVLRTLQSSFASLACVVDAVNAGSMPSSDSARLLASIEEGLKGIDEAIRQDPKGTFYGLPFAQFRAYALVYKAIILGHANQGQEGLSLLRDAVRLSPDSVFARSTLVECLLECGHENEAEEQRTELRRLSSADEPDEELAGPRQETPGTSAKKGCWG